MWTKLCGFRELPAFADGERPDAIGLNFASQSPRCVTPELARDIIRKLPDGIEPVGVFVNTPPHEIREVCEMCGIHTVQLHGDEPAAWVAELSPLRVIKAFRVDEQTGLRDIEAFLQACEPGGQPWACLVDSRSSTALGGTGVRAPWNVVAAYRRSDWPRLILAGGLTPANVVEAIRAVQPWGVDTASGVETAVACKDAGLMRQFVVNARRGFAEPDQPA